MYFVNFFICKCKTFENITIFFYRFLFWAPRCSSIYRTTGVRFSCWEQQYCRRKFRQRKQSAVYESSDGIWTCIFQISWCHGNHQQAGLLKVRICLKVEYPFLTLIILFCFRPSPIQAQAWPYLLSGKDVIGIAQTGRKDCIQIFEIRRMLSHWNLTNFSRYWKNFGISDANFHSHWWTRSSKRWAWRTKRLDSLTNKVI